MQPPPRKGNYAKFLKNLHSEQINKLIAKNQHECDLLEDIRSFILKRSSIEKSYSEALLKISSAYLNKKIPNIPDIKIEGGEEKWNMWNVWRTVLEENEKLARARLAAVEVFQQQIADDAKILRAHKMQMARKCVEHLAVCQKELQACIQEVDKTKKLYFDEEHCAHDVRDKARDIEEKLKKKKGSFFQSITSLQKNSAKFSSKREQLEEKSTGARNDYLLCLAAANAHQTRYFVVDLQQAMTTMEAGVYDRVAEYLTLMGRTELLTCSAMQNSFTVIRDQAKQLTREYNVQCCYLHYPVLKQHITYEFEACDNDPVETVTAEHDSSAATLSKEARRWATRIARENNVIRESSRKLQIYVALRESGQKTDPNDPNGPDLETKIDEMRENIRKAETARAKAEARIECLREGGVNVDEWLQEAESLNVQDIQRSASSLSDHPSSDSFYDSDFADGEPTAAPTGGSERIPLHSSQDKDKDDTDSQSEQYENPEVDAMLEQERQRIEQLTAGWDDPTQVDWGNEDTHGGEDGDRIRRPGSGESQQQDATSHHPSATLLKCTALYSYTAQNPDELTIVENEQLEVVGEGDGDGWLRARNYKGEEGYVPHNYLDVEREQSSQTTPHGLVNQISFSSVDYTIDNEEDSGQQTETTNQSPEQISVISVSGERPIGWATDTAQELDTPAAKASSDSTVSYCVALYDYEGEGEEELTLEEGQIIKVLSKCAHSVDDGWWQGELEGRVGNFPSLVVEECDENGEPLTDQWDETPPQSAPPVFTPPDVPNFVMGAASAEMPPSSTEHPPSDPAPVLPETPDTSAFSAFSMALTRNQQQHYGTQFQGPEGVPTIDIPSVEVFGEDDQPEESSSLSNTKQSSSAPAAAGGGSSSGDDFGLGVAQIVITAATPMMEEPDSPFPPPEGDDEDDDNTNDPHHNASPSPDEGVASGGENGCCDPILEENEDEEDEGNDDDLEDDDRGGRHFGNGTPLDDDDFHAKFDEEKDKRQKQESWKKCEPPPRPPLSSEQQQQERQPEMTGCSGSSSGPGQTAVSGAVDLPEELEDDAQGCGGGGGGGGDRTPFLASSSTGSDGETTGPSTAENSVSHVISGAGAGAAAAQVTGPVVVGATATGSTNGDSTVTDIPCKQVVGGRASIPDELEPHQLARLQDLKESNA